VLKGGGGAVGGGSGAEVIALGQSKGKTKIRGPKIPNRQKTEQKTAPDRYNKKRFVHPNTPSN